MSWRPGFNSGLKALSLGLWGVVLVQSGASGRLDLLLRAVFHPLVWISGGLLLALAVLELVSGKEAPLPPRQRLGFLAGCLAALAVLLLPPVPSFADLAANRSQDFQPGPGLNFVVPPGQRSLTEWVRLLRSEPDPKLHQGDPVKISGFVLPMPGDRPQLARLLVRCCLVDAVPVGLPVLWPADQPTPEADQWLAIEGVMENETVAGQNRSVVRARQVRPIPRPQRPLEP